MDAAITYFECLYQCEHSEKTVSAMATTSHMEAKTMRLRSSGVNLFLVAMNIIPH